MTEEDTSSTWQRGWRGHGDNSPVNHYEFYAVIDPLERGLKEVNERIEDIEDRLVETRAKHLLVDLFVTGTGRFFLVVMGLIAAYVVSRLGYNPLP